MSFDFDNPRTLRGRHTSKYDAIQNTFGYDAPDMIAMWVADMDFAAAPAILKAMKDEVDYGYMGYFNQPQKVNAAVANWYRDRHGWDMEPGWVRYTHGVISGYADVIATYSEPGDGVILFSPVYHAFFRQIEAMGRVAVESPMVLRDGQYHMDLDALAASLTGREKIVTFCSPHNPGGRIWSVEEIRALADFCAEHDLILISDEIHLDLTFPGVEQVPTVVAAPEHADRIAVLTAASKAFNIAGLETGLLIAPGAEMRARLAPTILDRESSPNRMGMVAIRAAFEESGDWLDAVQAYIAGNFELFAQRMNALPGVSVMPMQATYLAWADFTGTGMDDKELMDRLLKQAHVAPSPGTQFRTGGSGHMRFNLALSRPMLTEALDRIEAAFADLQ
ncbi:MalY/PatB family protein [Silicimonas sp. MF1-12-2]|uniref:MalY/PatB family protein n=1 Tax=Silicimonas sp. MF1-12-2 TaxID=3384793 RepID=UPI0039B4949F